MNMLKSIWPLLLLSFISLNLWAQAPKDMTIYDKQGLKITGHLQAGVNLVSETNLFWNLANIPGVDFNSDPTWLESYVKPGISFQYSKKKSSSFYGKISGVGSYTLGVDAFDARNTGRVTLEEAYLGYRWSFNDSLQFAITVGSRELALGTGMLISNGASSGFERGALKLGPRKAWQKAAIAEFQAKNLQSKIFFLEPNELSSNNTENQIAGADIQYKKTANSFIGLTYVKVLKSLAPYAKAAPNGIGAPTITPGDRKGLNALNLYTKGTPLKEKLPSFFIGLDATYEWNQRIDLKSWAGRIQAGYNFTNARLKPTVMYSYQVFSGDDPYTVKQERYDPLYYEGSPSAWSTGSKASMVLINSNVQAHGITIRTNLTQKDVITFRYALLLAQQLRSPIQFGQATRVDFSDGISTVVSGVTDKHIADDVFVEYNRVINANIYLNAGVAVSFPGRGIRNIVGHTSNWSGGFVNMIVNF